MMRVSLHDVQNAIIARPNAMHRVFTVANIRELLATLRVWIACQLFDPLFDLSSKLRWNRF
jgi:hypothetical protein